jgi:hypothetical protein
LVTGDGPTQGRGFVGAGGSFDRWADFGGDLSEADRADSGKRLQQLRLGVLVDGGCDRPLELSDRTQQRAYETRLILYQRFDDVVFECVLGLRCVPQPRERRKLRMRVSPSRLAESGLG